MNYRIDISKLNKDLAAAIQKTIASHEGLAKGIRIIALSTEREPQEDGNSFVYRITAKVQATTPTEGETESLKSEDLGLPVQS